MRRARWIAALALAGALACGGPGEFTVEDAHVVPSPAGSGPAGGFLTLRNESAEAVTLVGAESHAAARIELHRSSLEGDVARMAPLAELTVEPGETVKLEPGGAHLMWFEPTLPESGTVGLRLRFADGRTEELEAEVRAAGATGSHDDHHH